MFFLCFQLASFFVIVRFYAYICRNIMVMEHRIKYPIGIQNFEEIIRDGWIYIDKTQYIKELLCMGKYYFLGRPRRFGKSLLLSTLHAFFDGKRDLFQNLSIGSWDEWDWGKYPVIHLDMNAKDYTDPNSVKERLSAQLTELENKYDVPYSDDRSVDGRFMALIKRACNVVGRPVVILIDEYDKPILDTMYDKELENLHRDTLRGFYSVLKSADKYIKLGFLTGITKFGQLNIFSGLNNLSDISLDNQFAGICGVTQSELEKYFHEGVHKMASAMDCSMGEAFQALKSNYDGYHFSSKSPDIYNPWSLLNALSAKDIRDYWNASGGNTSFLYKIIVNGNIELKDLTGYQATADELYGPSLSMSSTIAMLYQTGYLTIKASERIDEYLIYTLGYPNREVERGFLTGILEMFDYSSSGMATFSLFKFVLDLRKGDIRAFMERMQSFFAGISHRVIEDREKHFQTIMYCISSLLGLQVNVEESTSDGDIDMTVKTDKYIYIFEFKLDKSPQTALEQIHKKQYDLKYAADGRKLYLIGVNFSTDLRRIDRYEIEVV